MIKQIIENAFKSWQECGGVGFNSQNDKLSLASKQSLLSMVKEEINHNQILTISLKNTCRTLYKFSDKSNPDTLEYFNKLNANRNDMRAIKKRIKQLSRIAKELKLSMQ